MNQTQKTVMTPKAILQSGTRVSTHTTEKKKRKITDTSKRDVQQKLLSNQKLPDITTIIGPRIGDRVATYGASPHKPVTNQTTEGITDVTRSSRQILGLLGA